MEGENVLRLCALKRENLRKAMEKVKCQASELLVFNLQWSNLEEYIKLAEGNIEKGLKEVKSKEMELEKRSVALEERAKAAEAKLGDLKMKADGVENEIQEKRQDLHYFSDRVYCCQTEYKIVEMNLVQLKTAVKECTVDHRSKQGQLSQLEELLRKTHVELQSKGEQLAQLETDLERGRVEKEHLDRNQTRNSELEEEIERKSKDLTALLNKLSDYGKQLECVAAQLDAQKEKFLETRSSEEKELKGLIEAKRSAILDLDLTEDLVKSWKNDIESKARELEDIEKMIEERNAHCDSIKLLIKEHNEELASKEKRQNEITLEIASQEKTLDRARAFIRELNKKQLAKENKLDSTKRTTAQEKKKLRSVKDMLQIKEDELVSLQPLIDEKNKQIEEGKKKMQDLDNSNEELVIQLQVKKEEIRECSSELESKKKELDQVQRSITDLTAELTSKDCDLNSVKKKIQDSLKDFQSKEEEKLIIQLQAKRDEVLSINNAIRECSSVLESKRKEQDQVQRSITDLTAELTSKECDLNSVNKKIQDSLEDFQSKEKQQVRLEASLMEREQELGLREKQFDARLKKIELKEKELEEKIVEKDEQLKSTEARQLSSLVHDEKTLQLLLRGHLKKCDELHLEVLDALKASSDPTKLVLDTIQAVTNLDPISVTRSSICLLECLMVMSPKPNSEVEGEAIQFATDWKNTTLVKAENPVEVLGFLHFLAVFSLAYSFDADKVQNLFDVAFLRKYTPSLCKALGVSAVKDVISLDDKPPEVAVSNSGVSPSPDVQENAGESQSVNGNALMDHEGSSASGLRSFKDPRRLVLVYVEQALVGAQQRGELDLAEPIVKNLIPFLEDMAQDTNPIDPHLQLTAARLANRWSGVMGINAQISPLKAWGFLLLIVAYRLVNGSNTNKHKILQCASYVTHFNQAPKLFQSLGLNYAIPNFVYQLLNDGQYIPAIRFIIFFDIKTMFSPVEFLKKEIINLRRYANEKRRFESQAVTYEAGGSAFSPHQVGFKRPRVDPPGPRFVVRPCFNPPSSGYGRY